jgi:hypothetical protein
MWWWKRSEIRWSETTKYGEALYYLPSFSAKGVAITNHKDKCSPFKTLEEAKEFLCEIEKGITYHY